MSAAQPIYIGTDGGATMSKIGGVWADGTTVSTELLQWPTNAQLGPEAVVSGWVAAISAYLEQNGLTWDQVQRVGVAIPGPRRSYGVLERGPNLPESFVGFDVYTSYTRALAERAGRPIPLSVGNDGNMAGMEASHMPAPLHLLGVPAYSCGCGRSWGCIEMYTALAGLPYLLADKLKQ